MEKLYDGISEWIYKQHFKDEIDFKDWQSALITKEFKGKTIERFYFGFGFDDFSWNGVAYNHHKHLFIMIRKNQWHTCEYDVFISNFGFRCDVKQLMKSFVAFSKEKEIDTIFSTYEYGIFQGYFPTGEQSKQIFQLFQTLKSASSNTFQHLYSNELLYKNTSNSLYIYRDLKRSCITLMDKEGTTITILYSMKDVETWNKNQQMEIKKIDVFLNKIIDTIQKQTNLHVKKDKNYAMLIIDKKTFVYFSISRIMKKDKNEIEIDLDVKKLQCFIDDEEKVLEFAKKFANHFRLRHITGTN